MKIKLCAFLLILCFVAAGAAGSAFAVATYLPGYSAGGYYDADKTNPDATCWMAAASNVLAWSGWGAVNTDPFLSDGSDEESIYSYLKSDYGTSTSGKAKDAYEDWFLKDGLESYTFTDYFNEITPFNTTSSANPEYAMYADDHLRNYIDNRYGSVISIQQGYTATSASHALTFWGYEDLNPDDNFIDIWVTDSDRDTDTLTQYNLTLGVALDVNNSHYHDLWYMTYGNQGLDWWVTGIQGLAAYDGGTPPPIPEPATMLLLGTGLAGLAGFGRKRFKKS